MRRSLLVRNTTRFGLPGSGNPFRRLRAASQNIPFSHQVSTSSNSHRPTGSEILQFGSIRRSTPPQLRRNFRDNRPFPLPASFSNLKRLCRDFSRQEATRGQPFPTIYPLSRHSCLNGNPGRLRSRPPRVQSNVFVRYRQGMPPLPATPRYSKLVYFQGRSSLLSLYRASSRLETLSSVFRQVYATFRSVSSDDSLPPNSSLHGRFLS